MATNLTPEQLQALQAYYAPQGSGGGFSSFMPYQADGLMYQSNAGGNADSGAGASQPAANYYQYDPNKKETGDPFNVYDTGGKFLEEGRFQPDKYWDLVALWAASALGMGTLLPGMTGAGAAGGGAAVPGVGEAGWGADLGMEGLAGATPSSGLAGAVPGVGEAGWGADLGMEGLAGATPTSGMGTTLTGVAGGPLAAGGAAGAAGAAGAGGAGAAAAGGTGLLGKGLGAAATVLGGAAGAQGQDASKSQTQDIPEYLKPYVMKQLGYAGGLLDQQMAPGYLKGYEDMRNVGQGLLNQPVAGNGFDRLTRGRY
jgi:hypothetical protein